MPPIDSYDAVVALGREVADRGFTALKTNVLIPGTPARGYGFGFGGGPPDQTVPLDILDAIERQLGAFAEGAGPGIWYFGSTAGLPSPTASRTSTGV